MRDIKSIFSENLRNKLIAKNKTQAQLAKFVGVSQTSVSLWCNGEVMPRSNMVDKIAKFLVCPSDELMTDHTKEVELAPEDIIAEAIHENPRLFRLIMYLLGNIDQDEYKAKSAELQQKIAEIQKITPVKTKIFTSNWHDLYAELDDEHRRSFWRNMVREIVVTVEAQPVDVLY